MSVIVDYILTSIVTSFCRFCTLHVWLHPFTGVDIYTLFKYLIRHYLVCHPVFYALLCLADLSTGTGGPRGAVAPWGQLLGGCFPPLCHCVRCIQRIHAGAFQWTRACVVRTFHPMCGQTSAHIFVSMALRPLTSPHRMMRWSRTPPEPGDRPATSYQLLRATQLVPVHIIG